MSQMKILEILPKDPGAGLSAKEVAEALDIAISTVRTELYRMKRQGQVNTTRYTEPGKTGSFTKWWRVE